MKCHDYIAIFAALNNDFFAHLCETVEHCIAIHPSSCLSNLRKCFSVYFSLFSALEHLKLKVKMKKFIITFAPQTVTNVKTTFCQPLANGGLANCHFKNQSSANLPTFGWRKKNFRKVFCQLSANGWQFLVIHVVNCRMRIQSSLNFTEKLLTVFWQDREDSNFLDRDWLNRAKPVLKSIQFW